VVVHYQFDLPVRRIVVVYFLQEFNEFPTSMTIPYQSMNVAVVKVKASHKTDCPETPVFVVSSPSAILVWYRRKVHSDVSSLSRLTKSVVNRHHFAGPKIIHNLGN
jgi:hypothetical protein